MLLDEPIAALDRADMQIFELSCVNRDNSGSPKSAVYDPQGGRVLVGDRNVQKLTGDFDSAATVPSARAPLPDKSL